MSFPDDPRDVEVGLWLNGAWVDAVATGNGVRESDPVEIEAGRGNWASRVDPARAKWRLDNRDGRWSPDNPASPYFGQYRLNIPTRVGVGDGLPALQWTGESKNMATTANHSSLNITGDIDIRIHFRMFRDLADISVAGEPRTRLANFRDGATGWEFDVAIIGVETVLRFRWWDSGGTGQSAETRLLPYSVQWADTALRVTLDVSTGTATFYSAPDLTGPWTTVEAVAGSATSIGNGSATLAVGGSTLDGSTVIALDGDIYGFELRDGIDGTLVASPDFTLQALAQDDFPDADGNVVTIIDTSDRTWTIGDGARVSDMKWRFHGELSKLPVDSDIQGRDITSPVEAAGILRRLRQSDRIDSALRRGVILNSANYIQYWPCEEPGDRTLPLFAADIGAAPLSITGEPNPAANTDFAASEAIPTLGADIWTAVVDTYSGTDWQVRWLMSIPSTFTGDGMRFLRVETNGSYDWEVEYRDDAGGQLRVVAYTGGTASYTGAWTSFDATGKPMRMTFAVEVNGGSVDVTLEGQAEDEASAGGLVVTSAVTGTPGQATLIRVNSTEDADGWGFGHITLQNEKTPSTELATELSAYDTETAAARVKRLCREEGVQARIQGDPNESEQMGPQRAGTFIDLLQECADTDLGLLSDARDIVGVSYRTRQSMIGQSAAVDFDYSGGELLGTPRITRDYEGLANDVTLSNANGAAARAILDDGTVLSVSQPPVGAGRYTAGYRVNGQATRLSTLAAFRLGLTTVNEPRATRLATAFQLAAVSGSATLAAAVLDLRLGDRVTVSANEAAVLGSSKIDQLLQGYQERIDHFEHSVSFLTSPSSPWAATPEAAPLSVSWVQQANGVDPQAVTNDGDGDGDTIIAVAVATGPGNETSSQGSWVSPPGGQVIFDYGGEQFVSRVRAWRLDDDGSASYTFGWDTSASNPCTCLLIGLNGPADRVVVTATPEMLGGAANVDMPYPILDTEIDDVVIAIGVSQTSDEMTAGPAGYTEEFNNTGTLNPRGIAAHTSRATGGSTQPGNSTYDGFNGAHIQFVVGAGGASTNPLLPAASWTVYVDPTDPDSWDDTRPDGQLIVAGNRWNVGDTTDGIQAGTGYGLSFDSNSEIHSFEMDDGDTLRLGPGTVTGLQNTSTALITKHQFDNNDPFGGVTGYQYQAGQENTTVGPNRSDRLFHDGTRTQLALIPNNAADPKAIRASFGGETGDQVLQAHVFRIEQWMLANDLNVAGGGVHASGDAQSPWSHFFGQSKFEVITRNTTTAWPSSGQAAYTSTVEHSEAISGTDVGDWWALVSDYTIDPLDGHLHVWLAKGSGGFSQIVNLNNGYGLSYADTDPNQDLFYAMLTNFYSWHNDQTNALNNWDDTYGNVRSMAYAFGGVIVSPSGVTVSTLQDHCNHFLQG